MLLMILFWVLMAGVLIAMISKKPVSVEMVAIWAAVAILGFQVFGFK